MFLGNIKEAFDKDSELKNLLLDDFFKKEIQKCQVYNCCIYTLGLFFNMFLFNDILYMYSQSKCPFFVQDSWRKVVCAAVTLGIPTPTFSSALAFYDGYRYVGQLLLSRGIKSPVNVSSEGRSSEREK